MVSVPRAYILLILLGFCIPSALLADSPSPLKEDVIRSFAIQLGIEPSSPDMKRLLTKRAFEHPPGADKPTKIVRHIRGNGGVPFPSVQAIQNYVDAQVAALRHPVDRPFKSKHEKPHKYVLAKADERELRDKLPGFYPRCKANQTLVDEAGAVELEGPVRVSYDILFTNKELVPSHPQKAFGNDAVVRVYDPYDSDSVVGIEIDQLGIRCLPSRIRVTTDGEFRMEGVQALHNYDDDPTGKRGYMDDEVKALLAH